MRAPTDTLLPPGWKPRLTGRQDARRYRRQRRLSLLICARRLIPLQFMVETLAGGWHPIG